MLAVSTALQKTAQAATAISVASNPKAPHDCVEVATATSSSHLICHTHSVLNVLIISESSLKLPRAPLHALHCMRAKHELVLQHEGSEACCSHNSQPPSGEQRSNDDKENDFTTPSLIQECQGVEREKKKFSRPIGLL